LSSTVLLCCQNETSISIYECALFNFAGFTSKVCPAIMN
jgi:hypothetical protein